MCYFPGKYAACGFERSTIQSPVEALPQPLVHTEVRSATIHIRMTCEAYCGVLWRLGDARTTGPSLN